MDCNKCDCPLRRTFKSSSLRTVTHVMVNNSLEGYGVFADIMLKKSKEIE